mgnify:FL=1
MSMMHGLARHPRRLNLLLSLVCFALVAIAVALEAIGGMEPCPLCVFQRMAFLTMGAALLLGVFIPGRLAAGLTALAGLAGIGLAWRHLWLQSLPPDQVPACGPGLDYLLEAFPLTEVVNMVLSGSGECAEVDDVLGLSIPVWTLVAYIGIAGLAIIINEAARRRPAAG